LTLQSNIIGIIADDLTGANDTALQFHLKGCNTQILLDYASVPVSKINTQAWAISTETRNKSPKDSAQIVKEATKYLINNFNIENIYKKIDSTLRGNIAQECLAVLEVMGGDAAVIVPAFPSEGRTTVGGYHLLKGMPIERTDVARDPHFPVSQSHVPTLLQNQVNNPEIVAHIQLNTVMKGAGPILMELKKMVEEHKKLIVIDAVTTTDMEQIALAIEKCNSKLLPCGSAGLAQVMTKCWLPDTKYQHITKVIPSLPIFILSGSKTALSKTQLKKLGEFDEFDSCVIELSLEQVITKPEESFIENIKTHLETEKVVAISFKEYENENAKAVEVGVCVENIPKLIMDYFVLLCSKIVKTENLILVTVGGETSYKCCNALENKHLQLIDQVEPAIPICLDHEARWIVTKSGNFGTPNTLINIVKYFKQHQEL